MPHRGAKSRVTCFCNAAATALSSDISIVEFCATSATCLGNMLCSPMGRKIGPQNLLQRRLKLWNPVCIEPGMDGLPADPSVNSATTTMELLVLMQTRNGARRHAYKDAG